MDRRFARIHERIMRLGSALASIKLDQGRGTKNAAKRPDKLRRSAPRMAVGKPRSTSDP